ncbi:MAG: alpha-E domain-containing protein [Pseudogulbenkiania sp.]|nr:alpha-E domain-containing protein [Pseudogulbenkiania sp.]
MLSRTADHLFWMGRYMERAENLARLLEVSHAISLMPQSRNGRAEISAPLVLTGRVDDFLCHHPNIDPAKVLHYMAYDLANPASILSALRSARENAHAVRGKISSDMWMSLNASWLEGRKLAEQGEDFQLFFDWVKERAHLFRGATYSTMRRSDAFYFIRLGTFLERADNTARLVDVKSQLLPDSPLAGTNDYYAWSTLLRTLGAFEAYHETYRDTLSGKRVIDLLLLREDMPRSLRACFDEIRLALAQIQSDNGRAAQRLATELKAKLEFTTLDEVFSEGLHPFLNRMLGEINRLGESIHRAYLEAA